MNERKRKIKSESGDERPSKKIALAAPPDIVDVRHVPVESEWLPILGGQSPSQSAGSFKAASV